VVTGGGLLLGAAVVVEGECWNTLARKVPKGPGNFPRAAEEDVAEDAAGITLK
jgi:hypothetical protein